MIPPSGSLVINTFPQDERGRAMGIYAGVSMVFLSLGPLIGGVLTEVSWRLVFPVNVPVAVVTILLTIVAKPHAEFRAEAQGVIQTMRQVGATIGLAIMGVVVTSVENSRLETNLTAVGLPPSAVSQVENVLSKGGDGRQEALNQVPVAARAGIVSGVRDSVTDGISAAFYIGGAALLVGALVAFLVLRHVRYADDGEAVAVPGWPVALRCARRPPRGAGTAGSRGARARGRCARGRRAPGSGPRGGSRPRRPPRGRRPSRGWRSPSSSPPA